MSDAWRTEARAQGSQATDAVSEPLWDSEQDLLMTVLTIPRCTIGVKVEIADFAEPTPHQAGLGWCIQHGPWILAQCVSIATVVVCIVSAEAGMRLARTVM